MNSRPFNAIVVSADRSLLRQLTKFLELFGYEVTAAADVTQAQMAAEAAGADFLLVDATLPERPGSQFCRTIRRTAPAGYTYAILITEIPDTTSLSEALEAGFDDFIAKPLVFGELLARLRAGARVVEFERRLAEQGGLEPATGFANASAFRDHVQDVLQTSSGEPHGSLVVLDIDCFSRVSHKHGSPTAQRLLGEFGALIKQHAPKESLVACLGSDRFALFLRGQTEEQGAAWSQQVLSAVAAQPHAIGEENVQLTASAGVCEAATGLPAEKVLDEATQALALAKASGRNCVLTRLALQQDTRAWADMAASGRLFRSTHARDVMTAAPFVLGSEETMEQTASLFEQTKLSALPVVDQDGRYLGIVTAAQLKDRRSKPTKGRSSNSVRLVRQVMRTDIPQFDESATLAELMEFFTGGGHTLAVILRNNRPTGLVYCQSLAALNERLSREQFVPQTSYSPGSEFLMVPDMTTAEAE